MQFVTDQAGVQLDSGERGNLAVLVRLLYILARLGRYSPNCRVLERCVAGNHANWMNDCAWTSHFHVGSDHFFRNVMGLCHLIGPFITYVIFDVFIKKKSCHCLRLTVPCI